MRVVASSGMVWEWRRGVLLAVAAVAVSACSGSEPAGEAISATPSPAGAPSAPAVVASEPVGVPSDPAGASDVALPPASELLPPDVTDLSSEQLERLRDELERALEQQREEMLEDLPAPELPSELLDDVLRP